MPGIAGVIFDKDGTLFDFHASWGAWSARLALDLAGGDRARAARLGRAIGFDLDAQRFAPDSPVIAETPQTVAELLLPHLPGSTATALLERMDRLAAAAPMVPAVPLAPLLEGLRARGLRLALVTNDSEYAARAHLDAHALGAAFDFIAGFDSGFGAKPQPGMLLAAAEAFGLDPARMLMVGDSRHDLIAGRAAGMKAVGVLTGPAAAEELAPLADAVIPDIGHLPALLDTPARGRTAP